MANNDNTAQSGPSTATAREVAMELAGFTKQLREAGQALNTEITGIKGARAEIKEEFDDTVKTFVKNTITDLTGEKFQEISNIAQNIPELGAQSLAFSAKKMTDARDGALATINASLAETIDADGFEKRYAQAQGQVTAAREKETAADTAVGEAQGALGTWRQSKDYAFVALDKEIAQNGGISLKADNRAYYESKGLFAKAWNHMTRGAEYRKVRTALKEYHHGEGGKDAFADLAGFKDNDKKLETAVSSAQGSVTAAQQEETAAQALVSTFSRIAPQIKTDDQILAAVQDKVVGFFSTPQFVTAVSTQYGEDFPRGIPLMTAKLESLDKLQAGVEEKLETANKNYLAASDQYTKVNQMKPFKQIDLQSVGGMDGLQKNNRARIQEYGNYTTAANHSWTHVRSYSPPTTIIYHDNSPSFFQMMLLADIMSNNRNYDYDSRHRNDYTCSPVSSYTADLMGVNKDQATTLGLPAAAFDTSPETQKQFADIGVSGYQTNQFLFDTAPAGSSAGAASVSSDALFDTAISSAATPSYSSREPDTSSMFDRAASPDRGYSAPSNDSSLFDKPSPSNDRSYRDDPAPSYGSPGGSGS